MKLNLDNFIEQLYDDLATILETVGWVRKDQGYFEYNPNAKRNYNGTPTLPESYLVLYPVLLHYEEHGEYQCQIWFKSGDRDMSEEARDKLFEVLKPFKDQDYSGIDFWVNPAYPDGYMCNHSLGTD
jgi:hypothetical protein